MLREFAELMCHKLTGPPVAQWLALQTAGQKVWGSNPIRDVGFFSPGRLLPRAGSAMGPVGRLKPHTSQMHL